jgi:peptidylprolyl isomerase
MRLLPGVSALALSACAMSPSPPPAAPQSAWRPVPVAHATEPSDVLKASTAADWRPVDPDNLLVLDLAGGGRVSIELAPDFAPVHVANIRALARAGWWKDATVYRVQENYVVQWGRNESKDPLPAQVVKTPPAEYDRPLGGLDVHPLGYPDSYAPVAGYANGWPVGYDPQSGRAWLAHCYGMVGAGRDLAPDTGTGGELYAVIGHAPRHLDLNIALVGRVLEGLDLMSAHKRGTEVLGFIKEVRDQMPIARIRLASDIAPPERPSFEVMRTDSAAFAAYLLGRANRSNPFFNRPAGGVDLCNALVPTRRAPR